MNKNKLGIDFTGTRIYYGKLLKDGMTISDNAKDISENNFLNVMFHYLENKTNGFEEVFEVQSKHGYVYEISVKKRVKE